MTYMYNTSKALALSHDKVVESMSLGREARETESNMKCELMANNFFVQEGGGVGTFVNVCKTYNLQCICILAFKVFTL